jgi:hypothetical protein
VRVFAEDRRASVVCGACADSSGFTNGRFSTLPVTEPYRVIDRVDGQRVYVYLIVDGRRDMQSLLARRLLGG